MPRLSSVSCSSASVKATPSKKEWLDAFNRGYNTCVDDAVPIIDRDRKAKWIAKLLRAGAEKSNAATKVEYLELKIATLAGSPIRELVLKDYETAVARKQKWEKCETVITEYIRKHDEAK